MKKVRRMQMVGWLTKVNYRTKRQLQEVQSGSRGVVASGLTQEQR